MKSIVCPVCDEPTSAKLRKTGKGKLTIYVTCPKSAKHLRAFVNDAGVIEALINEARRKAADTQAGDDSEVG
jgi:hypothetical protein